MSQLSVRCVISHLFFSALRLLVRSRTLILSDISTPLCSSNFTREYAQMTQEVLGGMRVESERWVDVGPKAIVDLVSISIPPV